MQLNLRQLMCFQAVLTLGTTKSAAKILNISQPAASMAISNLEHQVGFILFNREKGRLIPTPEAHQLYETVKTALNSLDNITYAADEIKHGRAGVITIAAYPGISIKFLPKLVSDFINNKPELSIKILSHSSRLVRDMMPSQEYDIGILELPANNPAAYTEKFSFKCMCVLPESSNLQKKDIINPEDLDGEPFIILFREHIIYHQIVNVFERYDSNLNIVSEVQYFSSACEMVSSGLGVAIVDPITASYFENQGCIVKPFSPEITYELAITHSKFHQLSKPATKFIELLREKLLAFTVKT